MELVSVFCVLGEQRWQKRFHPANCKVESSQSSMFTAGRANWPDGDHYESILQLTVQSIWHKVTNCWRNHFAGSTSKKIVELLIPKSQTCHKCVPLQKGFSTSTLLTSQAGRDLITEAHVHCGMFSGIHSFYPLDVSRNTPPSNVTIKTSPELPIVPQQEQNCTHLKRTFLPQKENQVSVFKL